MDPNNTQTATGAPATNRSRRASRRLLLAAAAVVFAVFTYNMLLWRSLGQQEVYLYGQDRWAPGTHAAMRVVLLRHRDQQPIRGASVRVLLARQKAVTVELASGRTNAAGTLTTDFTVPEGEGPGRILVIAVSRWGKDFIQRPIRLTPAYQIYLSPDRPAYRPGQKIRLHAWVSQLSDEKPASRQAISLHLFSPGNVLVAERTPNTDTQGRAAAELPLAAGAPAGDYRITATVGGSTASATLPVSGEGEPAFPTWLSELTPFVMPGELVHGAVHATDRLGSALRNASVRVWLENASGHAVSWSSGRLNAQGQLSFGLPAPSAPRSPEYHLCAAVTDSLLRTTTVRQRVAIVRRPIQLAAIPEAGTLIPGVENRIFLIARYPDGTPAAARLRVNLDGRVRSMESGLLGVTLLSFTPTTAETRLTLSARDAQDRTGFCSLTLPARRWSDREWALREKYRLLARRPGGMPPGPLLLRPNRGVYAAGEPLQLEVLTSAGDGTVYLDGWNNGQTVFTTALALRDGRGSARVKLPEKLAGTVWLRAYRQGPWGDLCRSQRAVFIMPSTTTPLALHSDRVAYTPGQMGRVVLRSRPGSATEILISRSAGGAADPMPPLVSSDAFTPPPGVLTSAGPGLSEANRRHAALAALAQLTPPAGWSLQVDEYAAKQAHLRERQDASWIWLRWVVLLTLAGLWLLAAHTLSRHKANAPVPAADEDALPAPAEHVSSPARFLFIAITVALTATILWVLQGRQPAPRHDLRGDHLLTALKKEREAQPAATIPGAFLPAPIRPETPQTDLAFRAAAARADATGKTIFPFPAPGYAGDWRVIATTVTGEGSAARQAIPLNVTADLLADLESPAIARSGDTVSVTVRLRNTLATAQTMRFKLQTGPELRPLSTPARTARLEGGASISRAFPVRVVGQPGKTALTLLVFGANRRFSVRRELEIIPDTQEARSLDAGLLAGPLTRKVTLAQAPREASLSLWTSAAALASAQLSTLPTRLPPGALARAAMVDIARLTFTDEMGKQAPPQEAMEQGFQELLACQDENGGIAAFPGEKPDTFCTAYTAAVLEAVGKTLPGAKAVAHRARSWLWEHQREDGSWPADSDHSAAQTTAFVNWCLGIRGGTGVASAWQRGKAPADNRAIAASDDPYLLALAIGAYRFTPVSPMGTLSKAPQWSESRKHGQLADRLAALAGRAAGGRCWLPAEKTMQGLTGTAGASETTALAILALLPHARYHQLARDGGRFLANTRQPDGSWGSPFATDLALRALNALAALSDRPEGAEAMAEVFLNQKRIGRLDPLHPTLDLRPFLKIGENNIRLLPAGPGPLYYELALNSGSMPPLQKRAAAPLLSAGYVPRRMRSGQAVFFTARLAGETARTVCLEVPLPAGFIPVNDDLEEMVERGQLVAYQATPRQLLLYADLGRRRAERYLALRLIAPGPCAVQAPPPFAYAVADPFARAYGQAARLRVE